MGIRKVTLAILASLCALAVGLLASSVPALAARDHIFGGSFGSAGAGNGQLSDPEGVAVNEVTGDVYVVDAGNDRVEYFTAAGVYLGQFDGSGTDVAVEGKAAPTGKLSSPQGIAIDNDPGSPSFGDVYVADVGNAVVDKFSSTGAYIGQITESSGGTAFGEIIGVAVGPNGTLWIDQTKIFENVIYNFSDAVANEFLAGRESQASASGGGFGGHAFAVDSNEDLYVKSFFSGTTKLDSSGRVLTREFDSLLKEPDSVEFPGAVVVNSSNNDVYVVDADSENSVARFSSKDAFIESFGSEQLSKGSGIAVDAATGEIYVADAGAGKIDRFGLEPFAAPTVEHEAPTEVTGTSATLTAQLRPTGPDTTYYFQYGTTSCAASPASCAELPTAPGLDIGTGFESQTVSVHLQGLQSGTVYHFRLIAINELGTTEAAEQSFRTQALGNGTSLPDGRSWELVSPPNKQGSGIIALGNEQGSDIQASSAGDGITYTATASFVPNPAGNRAIETTQVISERQTPGSWTTSDIATPHEEQPAPVAVGEASEYKLFSSDLSVGLVEPAGDTPLPPLPAGSSKTIYFREANGTYSALVSSANVPTGVHPQVSFISANPDLSHVIIESSAALTSTPVEQGLYELVDGQPQLVSILPDHTAVPAELGDRGYSTNGNVRHAISNDGSRIVWEGEEGHYYLRNMSADETVRVDAAQGAPEPAGETSHYQTADGSGSRVFFTSSGRLTADSTASEAADREDLYVFEVTSGEGQPLAGGLTDLSIDRNSGESADVRGVLEASEDGSYIYFVANGVLGDGAEHGARGGNCEQTSQPSQQTCNLYVEHYETAAKAWSAPRFITMLSGADSPSWGEGRDQTNLDRLTARVSPNGRYLTFMSERSLTGYENRDANSGVPDEEVFLYDASTGHLVCASCDPTGARPVGIFKGGGYEERLVSYTRFLWEGRWLAGSIPGWTTKDLSSAIYQSRYLSNSGRLFFNNSDALVPADVNGKEDVYEYEPDGVGSCQGADHGQSASDVFDEGIGGCIALISSGTSSEESAFMDASESGGDVFFLTLSHLSPLDYDTSIDMYDAHECTTSSPCAPPPALTPPACTTGDACKAAPTPQPALFGAPSSETFSGAGNVVPSTSTATVGKRSSEQAQKLSKALKACRKKPKRQQAGCERKARKRYTAKQSRAGQSRSVKSLGTESKQGRQK